MKKVLLTIVVVLIAGCSYEGEKNIRGYLEEPQYLIKDPHYASHKEQLDAVESRYLNKEISYAEYLAEKKELEGKYDREVQERNEKVAPYN